MYTNPLTRTVPAVEAYVTNTPVGVAVLAVARAPIRARRTGAGWFMGGDFVWRITTRDIQAVNTITDEITMVTNCARFKGSWMEGNVLFNDALNTFYLRLDGVRFIVKDHSDSETGNPLSPHGLLFPISSKGSFICIIQQTG